MIPQLENLYRITHYIARFRFVEDPGVEHNTVKMNKGLILRV